LAKAKSKKSTRTPIGGTSRSNDGVYIPKADPFDDAALIRITTQYRQEASDAKRDRMQKNKDNFDCYHMRESFSEKLEGQSREFLPKMAAAVDMNSIFIQQGLVDIGEWFSVDAETGMVVDAMKVKPSEVYKLLDRQLQSIGIVQTMSNAMKLGMIGSLMIAKVGGEWVPKPKYKTKDVLRDGKYSKQLVKIEDKGWRLKIDLVRQEDYYPDPSGKGLYEIEDLYLDFHEVAALADQGLYDKSVLDELRGTGSNHNWDQESKKARETDQQVAGKHFRNVVKVTECWGSIIDEDGDIIHENVMWTIGNDRVVLQKPTPNPLWHGESPYIAKPVMDVPGSVWGKALMDAPTRLNAAINEMFNLILDGGLMSVHGIKQLRRDWLEDEKEVEDGIYAGQTLSVNSSCPPGMTALQRVDTATIPPEGINVLNLVVQEFNTAAMTNDLRMGATPFRQVKATEIVESSQTITSMFSGMAKHIEEGWVTPLLEKCWKTVAQHTKDIDVESLKTVLGSARAEELKNLDNQDLFAATVGGCKFRVFGISAVLNQQKDFAKYQGLLQTIMASPSLQETFGQKYDVVKLLEEIIKAIGIKPWKIEHDDGPVAAASPAPQAAGPDMQSQIPQAGAAGNQGDQTMEAQTAISGNTFPGSRADSVAAPSLQR
jgi:hypothetical protein